MSLKTYQIDENYIKSMYQEITEHIENYQKEFNKDFETFDRWAKTVCHPKYKLIKNLVYLLEQNDTSFQDKQIIFSIFHQLLLINPNISMQLQKFNTLPKVLLEYLLKFKQDNGKNDICAVSTLSFSFKIEKYQNLINLEIFEILFDSLNQVKETNVIENLIKLFIEINYIYKDESNINSNIFLKVFNEHENSNLFAEIILRILNNEKNNEFIQKILYCIKCLMNIKQTDIFYSKDLEAFIDISINFLESTEIDELRTGILDILYILTKFEEFYKIEYKRKELQELLEDCAKNDMVTAEVQEKSQNILNNLNGKMNNEANNKGINSDYL